MAVPAQGPAPEDGGTRVRDPFCWRGRPLPRCGAFALFELSGHEPLGSTAVTVAPDPTAGRPFTRQVFERHLSWTLGAMRNVSARTAVGGAFVGAAAGEGHFVAVTGRARWWAGPNASVEAAAGPALVDVRVPIVVVGQRGYADARRPGVLGEARANVADLLALSARAVVVPNAGGRTQGAGYVGASLGSHAAVAGNVVLGALFGLLFYALSQGAS